MTPEEALAVAADFQRYIKTVDESHIAKYDKKTIMLALGQILPADKHHQWYKAMEKQVAALEQIEKQQQSQPDRRRERLKDRAIGFVLGIAGAVIAALIIKAIF